MNNGSNWTCPYCAHAQVIAEERHDTKLQKIYVQNWNLGHPAFLLEAIVCSNTACRKLNLQIALLSHHDHYNDVKVKEKIQDWRLLPASFAKPFPDFIPEPLRRDYEEACAIRDLSPKASATLIRRCIQGIIRDFCEIKKGTLKAEIEELRKRVNEGNAPLGVQHDVVDAIDHVRGIGNIGAHMEKDINVIVDVDPDEAQTLINLAELLFEELYVARALRKSKLEKLGVIANGKVEAKKQKQLPAPQKEEAQVTE